MSTPGGGGGAGAPRGLRVATLTCSDTRTAADDESGAVMRELLEGAGFSVDHAIVADDRGTIGNAAVARVDSGEYRAVILSGGTGLAPRDVTCEAIRPMLHKELEGFGEAFRRLSWDEIGPRAVLSRCIAGSRGTCFIAVLPGSSRAVRLAMREIIVPILPHALDLLVGKTHHEDHRKGSA